MITRKSFNYIHTDQTTHFTDALAQNASEYEDIAIPFKACQIESIRLLSDQNLAWMVSFHRRDNIAPTTDSITNFNNNTMIDFWAFATGDARAVGTAYVYAVSGLNIPFRDEESYAGYASLHVALHNRSATAKNAVPGAGGQVQITFGISSGMI